MANTITSAIQATTSLATSDTWTVTDSHDVGGRTVTFGTGGTTTYWRPFIASTATPGTPSTTIGSPKSLLAHVGNQVNAGAGGTLWVFAVNAGGFITAKYNGTGTGTLAVGAGPVARVLGLPTSTTSLGFTAGQTQTFTYHPTHCLYTISRPGDDHWQDDPPLAAIGEPRDGSTYVVAQDSSAVQTRTFRSRFHPYDWATRATLGMATGDGSATPLRGDSSRRKVRSGTAGVTPPWGWDDCVYAFPQTGGKLGALLGVFQTYVTGGVSTFDECYLSADTATRRNNSRIAAANWDRFTDIESITLRWYGTGTL